MNRREFLKYNLYGAFWIATGTSGLFMPKKIFADTVPDIAVAKGKPGAATRAAVELLGGMKKIVKPGDQVLIKPNMSFSTPPGRASNTHPLVVREIALMCKEAGAGKVLILDNTLDKPEQCLKNSGIFDACKALDDQMVRALANSSFYQETDIPKAVSMSSNDVMKDALKSDVLIAAPVAKSHSSTHVSLSMKGMMGLIYNRRVMHWRYNLDKSIVDLCTLLKADLTVIDGTRVLSTGGPHGPGKVLHEKTVIASKDMVAADAYAVSTFEWYGKRLRPKEVGHILEAHNRGLGRMDVENMTIKQVVL